MNAPRPDEYSTEYSPDERWMHQALSEAKRCLRQNLPSFPYTHPDEKPIALRDDVPIGAVCVRDGEIIARGHNRREADNDPCAHAEVLAIREAACMLGTSHLEDVTLYVTMEPCPMCAGAIWLARLERVVFGAWDTKAGACGSVYDLPRDPRLNHRPQLRGGVLEAQCEDMLRAFFAARRKK